LRPDPGEQAVGDHPRPFGHQARRGITGLFLAQGRVEQPQPMREVPLLKARDDDVLDHRIARELAAGMQHRTPEPLHPLEVVRPVADPLCKDRSEQCVLLDLAVEPLDEAGDIGGIDADRLGFGAPTRPQRFDMRAAFVRGRPRFRGCLHAASISDHGCTRAELFLGWRAPSLPPILVAMLRRFVIALALLLPAVTLAQQTTDIVLETERGDLVIAHETERAPVTSANFLRYQDQKRLHGTVVCRARRPERGDIVVAPETERAPITSANFLRYVDEKRLDGTVFYRAMRLDWGGQPSGLIQGGTQFDPERILPPIAHEPTSATGVRHVAGAI